MAAVAARRGRDARFSAVSDIDCMSSANVDLEVSLYNQSEQVH